MSTRNPWKIAPAGTLLGMLQRGRGAGFLEAQERSPGEVHPLLLECLRRDPRWDQQLEQRGAYYAALIHRSDMDFAFIEPLLTEKVEPEHDKWGEHLWLAFETLEELVRRGRQDALPMLRRYLERGRYWGLVAEALQDTGRPEAWEGALEILQRRFPTGAELAALADHLDVDRDPGPSWRAACPSLDAECRRMELERTAVPNREHIEIGFRRLSVAALFDRVDSGSLGMMRRIVRSRIRPQHRALLREHLVRENGAKTALALYGAAALGQAEDWEAFRDFVEGTPHPARFLWGHLVRSAESFPAWLSLPCAREWFDSPILIRTHVARHVLAEHAQAQDLELLLAAISPALAEDEMGHVCSLLEGIGKLPAAGRLPEVEHAFEEATYAWVRRDAALAMLVHAPERFVRCYAPECLWDAEPRLRILGCRHADRSEPRVRARMRELAADLYEDEDVVMELSRRGGDG